MRAALVLFEGLPATVIDSQVLAHVRLVRETLGIELSVVAVACSHALFESSKARLAHAEEIAGSRIQLLRGMRPAIPSSLTVNRLLLNRALAQIGSISLVHARTDYAAAVVGPWGRRHAVPVLWDCRGDSLAEMRERLGRGLARTALPYRASLQQHELRVAGKTCSGALFVSEQLRDLRNSYLVHQPAWVVPCLAEETEFFYEPALRARIRAELGVGPDESVYVYSGSLTSYQLFDEAIAIFRAALASGQRARLIVLTPEQERARKVCAEFPDGSAICRSVRLAEVNGYLNAADFALLLRDPTPVNIAAFPTKFAEYAMAGLTVLMKETPPACVAIARELGNYLAAGTLAAPAAESQRKGYAARARGQLGRRAAMPKYGKIYQRVAATRT